MPNIALLAWPHLQLKAFGRTSGRQSKDTRTPRSFQGRGIGSYHHCHAKQLDKSGLTYSTSPTLFSGMQKGVDGQKGDKKNERRTHVKVSRLRSKWDDWSCCLKQPGTMTAMKSKNQTRSTSLFPLKIRFLWSIRVCFHGFVLKCFPFFNMKECQWI